MWVRLFTAFVTLLPLPFFLANADNGVGNTQHDKQARKVDPNILIRRFCQWFPQTGKPDIGESKQLGRDVRDHIPQNQRLDGQTGTQLKCRDTDQQDNGPVQFVPVAAGVLINAITEIQHAVQQRNHGIDDGIHRHKIDPFLLTHFPFASRPIFH